MIRILSLAALSGVPALVYQVVWTREVALLAGSQVEATSAVLVAFFGGLALGSRALGPRADRARHPLRLYAALEAGAAGCAATSVFALRGLGEAAGVGGSARLAASCALLAPASFLLGGTLPALLRSALREPAGLGRVAGWLVGCNTCGAVAGVALATLAIPAVGLRAALLGAAAGGAVLAALALLLSAGFAARAGDEPAPAAAPERRPVPLALLLAAAGAGAATLAFEVLAGRAAGLVLGSTLVAWAVVLALFLAALAAGNLACARFAARTERPDTALGVVEAGAALALTLGLLPLVPGLATPATGLSLAALGWVALGVVPAAALMGSAFPLLVRLGGGSRGAPAGAFSRVSAANTAGGIVGALAAPFFLLPTLGLESGALACAALNAVLAAAFLARGAEGPLRAAAHAVAVAALVGAPALAVRGAKGPPDGAHVLYVAHGRQATAVVVGAAGRRDLIVDGDPEASTAGAARRTEQLLAAIPLLLHENPRQLLEVGLGAGITLGTAARFPLERLDCVEISDAVLGAAPFFAPENGGVASGRLPRVRIALGDARIFVAGVEGRYDLVLANTVHPWSVGATGLYSREYFARVRRALRPGGIAAQWLPLERIGADALGDILRTFFEVFPEGALWWGAGDLLVLGSETPLPPSDPRRVRERLSAAGLDGARLGIRDATELASRRIGDAEVVRAVLGRGPILSDDRPLLEARAARRRAGAAAPPAIGLVVRIAERAARRDPTQGPLLLWLESLAVRAAGREEPADRREALAEAGGLGLAREARLERAVAEGARAFREGRIEEAARRLDAVLVEEPTHRDARLARARLAIAGGERDRAVRELRRLLRSHPDDAEAWNQLGALLDAAGEASGARDAFERALEADSHFPDALANAGILAAEAGDRAAALERLARLRAVSPLGPAPAERALRAALEGGQGS